MDKKCLLILISLIYLLKSERSFSQTWCPPGASWYYTDDGFYSEGYSKLTYSADTVINTITCKKITHYYKFYSKIIGFKDGYAMPYFTYAQNGTVYIYNNKYGNNKFDTLFNINAQPGDRWRMPLVDTACADSLYYMKVLNTGTTNINGYNLKWLYLEKKFPSGGVVIDTIIDRLGYRYDDIDYIECRGGSSEAAHGKLRCYSDNSFGVYSTGISNSCDLVTGVPELGLPATDFKIFPNPAHEKLNAVFHADQKSQIKLFIYDLSGKLLTSDTFNERTDQLEISTAALENGVYFCSWYINDNFITCNKLTVIH